MKKYVVGFLFNKDKTLILLIERTKDDWQKGLFNGIGGKIENDETPIEAMKRESIEESGIDAEWIEKAYMSGANNDGNGFECTVFYAYSDKMLDFIQDEDSKKEGRLQIIITESINDYKLLENCKFLIPYGMCNDHSKRMVLEY